MSQQESVWSDFRMNMDIESPGNDVSLGADIEIRVTGTWAYNNNSAPLNISSKVGFLSLIHISEPTRPY